MKLSIIIPVYNVEKYLAQCIESILVQKNTECEIILVDDGSIDDSGKICDEYASNVDNIVVVHQKNKGLAGARNTGIRQASGEYIMFVDSDDFLNESVNLNNLICNLSADIIQYKWIYFFEKTGVFRMFEDYPNYENKPYWNVISDEIKEGILSISACNKIVRRSVLIDNNLFFDESLLSEDIDWSLRLYLKASSICVVNEDVYVYRQQREGSITTSSKKESIVSLFRIIKKWYHFDYPNSEIKNIYLSYLAYQYLILLTISNKKNCDNLMKKEILKYKEILKFDRNFKVRMSNQVFNILGIKLGLVILKLYWELRKKNFVKI